MPNSTFPKNPIQVRDYLNVLGLPPGDVYAHFDFTVIEEVDCSVIDRVIIGPDRNAIEQYHATHGAIPAAKRFSGTSDLGFGSVVVVSRAGDVVKDDMLILVTEKRPDPDDPGKYAAVTLSISKEPTELDAKDQQQYDGAQANCTAKMSAAAKAQLQARVQK